MNILWSLKTMKKIRICHPFKPVTQNQHSQHPTHSPWSCHIWPSVLIIQRKGCSNPPPLRKLCCLEKMLQRTRVNCRWNQNFYWSLVNLLLLTSWLCVPIIANKLIWILPLLHAKPGFFIITIKLNMSPRLVTRKQQASFILTIWFNILTD